MLSFFFFLFFPQSPTVLSPTPFLLSLELMPARAMCCEERAVLVTVYVEKPRRRRFPSPGNRRHHRHHNHHNKPKITNRRYGGGFDRKADLLLYSQHLRETARRESAAPTPSHHSASSNSTSYNPRRMTKTVSVRRNRNYAPTCLGNWKRVFRPSFLRSWGRFLRRKEERKKRSGSAAHKMNTIIKSFDFKKKWGLVSKLFSTLKKRRY